MKILIDTNIIVDFLDKRINFFLEAQEIFHLALTKQINGFMSTSCLCELHHYIKKTKHNEKETIDILKEITKIFYVLEGNAIDCLLSLNDEGPDFIDQYIAETAKRWKMDYIITRNTKHFKNSKVPAIEPKEFLKIYKKKNK